MSKKGRKSIFYKSKNIIDYTFKKKFLKKYPEYEGKDITKAMQDFFETSRKLLTTEINGIVLDNMGYFSNAVFQKKPMVVNKIFDKKPHFNLITEGHIYRSYFFPRVLKDKTLYNWSFRICEKGKSEMANSIQNGIRYKCQHKLLNRRNNGRKYFLRSVYK